MSNHCMAKCLGCGRQGVVAAAVEWTWRCKPCTDLAQARDFAKAWRAEAESLSQNFQSCSAQGPELPWDEG